MNILVVSSKYPPEYSGSGLRAHNTYRRLAHKFGIKYSVITSSITSNKTRNYILDGIHVKVIANKSNKMINLKDSKNNFSKLFKRIINKFYFFCDYLSEGLPAFFYLFRNGKKFDTIHIFGNVAITSASISYAKIMKKSAIVELVNLVDNPHFYEPKLISVLFGRGFPKRALIVCISEYLRKVCKNYGYLEQQIWCRPNPVDENKFYYEKWKKYEYREKIGHYAKSDIIILHLAKFIPRKKQDFIVRIMSLLPDDYKLILAGPLIDSGPFLTRDREYYRNILDNIRSAKLQERIQVIPHFIDNPEDYIKSSDIFVMPTIEEGFGTPFLEALACGVPVVANDIPGVFDQWIKPGINGYICKLDHKLWADKIVSATKIDEQNMKKTSEEILKVASTEVMDQEYFQRLTLLTKQ